MLFLRMFGVGFAITMGVEIALGLCIAIGRLSKGANK